MKNAKKNAFASVFISCIIFITFITITSCGGEEPEHPDDDQNNDEIAVTDDEPVDNEQPDEIVDEEPVDEDQQIDWCGRLDQSYRLSGEPAWEDPEFHYEYPAKMINKKEGCYIVFANEEHGPYIEFTTQVESLPLDGPDTVYNNGCRWFVFQYDPTPYEKEQALLWRKICPKELNDKWGLECRELTEDIPSKYKDGTWCADWWMDVYR